MIHSTAIISPNATLGSNVTIGAFSIVHDHVVISDNTTIGNYCEIGLPSALAKKQSLKIGDNSVIRSHSVIYIGSDIGANFHSGHYVSIRENSLIGEHCQIGSRGDIQGDCEIGNYTKMHADVHIGKQSKIGNYVWLFPEVLLTNDPMPPSDTLLGVSIEDFAVLAAKVLVLPGVAIGKDAVVAAGTLVKDDIPEGKLVNGNPSKIMCDAKVLRMHDNPKIKAYPWRERFHRGYSESDIQSWFNEK
ncbi:N-acetyltransferase [Psychrobium sp. MM17-31]|uniref:acyltransferase n=1 Tax=Psychrobium sp. MM17-31 TaxID=2917758 RepID=UPI001EF4A40E|nr:acyltransferase [Psychrobium sp. MM17-31]MCG7531151.1 N-acetyltransferase [Psychrobium sp. MM17-31]